MSKQLRLSIVQIEHQLYWEAECISIVRNQSAIEAIIQCGWTESREVAIQHFEEISERRKAPTIKIQLDE